MSDRKKPAQWMNIGRGQCIDCFKDAVHRYVATAYPRMVCSSCAYKASGVLPSHTRQWVTQ